MKIYCGKDIKDNDVYLNITYADISYGDWKSLNLDLDNIIKNIIKTSILLDNQFPNFINSFMCKELFNSAYRLIDEIINPYRYNYYIDTLCSIYLTLIDYDKLNHINKPKITKTKQDKVKKNKIKNEYTKLITTDLFTGKETYIYENSYTNDTIHSDNPNLLDELNHKHKEKRTKIVEFHNLVFNFNIKIK